MDEIVLKVSLVINHEVACVDDGRSVETKRVVNDGRWQASNRLNVRMSSGSGGIEGFLPLNGMSIHPPRQNLGQHATDGRTHR